MADAADFMDLERMLLSAFEGVTRAGGTSWTDSISLDLMGVAGKDFFITHRDDDRTWQDVAADEGWNPDAAIGGWAFLDPVGFRYYLAAAMWRMVKGSEVGSLAWQFRRPVKAKGRRRFEERWSLDGPQHAAAMRFAAAMRDAAFERGDGHAYDEWSAAIDSWRPE